MFASLHGTRSNRTVKCCLAERIKHVANVSARDGTVWVLTGNDVDGEISILVLRGKTDEVFAGVRWLVKGQHVFVRQGR